MGNGLAVSHGGVGFYVRGAAMREVRVKVIDYGPHRNLMLVYRDPINGKRVARSAGTRDLRQAAKRAVELEREINATGFADPAKMTWGAFVERYDRDKLASLAATTQQQSRIALDLFGRLVGIQKVVASIVGGGGSLYTATA
jgi:hypothetical protein